LRERGKGGYNSMQWKWGDPNPAVRVFGIVIAGAIIVGVVLSFCGPGEILGMTRIYFIMLLVVGIFAAALGMQVVIWFRNRDE
jgi:hypothetical protein